MTDLPTVLRPLNDALTPILRLGILNPLPLTGGLVLLEVEGRRTGATRTVPLVCGDHGPFLVVSTVRSESQWVSNLAANPLAAVWLRGRRRSVAAVVIRQGQRIDEGGPPDDLPTRLATAVSRATDTSLALLYLR